MHVHIGTFNTQHSRILTDGYTKANILPLFHQAYSHTHDPPPITSIPDILTTDNE